MAMGLEEYLRDHPDPPPPQLAEERTQEEIFDEYLEKIHNLLLEIDLTDLEKYITKNYVHSLEMDNEKVNELFMYIDCLIGCVILDHGYSLLCTRANSWKYYFDDELTLSILSSDKFRFYIPKIRIANNKLLFLNFNLEDEAFKSDEDDDEKWIELKDFNPFKSAVVFPSG